MPNHLHYFPIMKWKRAERIALRELQSSVKERIIPLILPVPTSCLRENGWSDIERLGTQPNIL
jgi:hypothetical protein